MKIPAVPEIHAGNSDQDHLYLFNLGPTGRESATATNGTVTCKRMIALAEEDEDMNRRLELYRYRVPEELYKVKKDPDCLDNMIHYPNEEKVRIKLEKLLEEWMVKTGDPILECFQKRDDAEFVEAYVQKLEAEANARRKSDQAKNKPKSKKKT